MSTLSLRIPDSIHKKVKDLSKKDHISINQFISSALSEKLSSYLTEEYIQERAQRASKSKFDAAMKQVPDKASDDFDKI